MLADGRVLNDLNKLKKDNTGYDLKNIFIGAEGTLGIITAAVLRLVPRPRSVETAFAGVTSAQAGLELLGLAAERAGGDVTSFEIMTRRGIELVLQHAAGCRDPLAAPHPWYVLIELSSQQREGLRNVLEELLAQGLERGLVADAAIADSLEQAKAFWRIREMFGEVQRHAGGSIKHDISVPVAAVPAFIAEADAAVTALIPGARPLPFGHLGDGNIHYNVTQPARRRQRRVSQALGRSERRGIRGGEEVRRLDFGRARHRRDETRPVAVGEGSGRARTDALAQAHARSQKHPQSRQGAVARERLNRIRVHRYFISPKSFRNSAA